MDHTRRSCRGTGEARPAWLSALPTGGAGSANEPGLVWLMSEGTSARENGNLMTKTITKADGGCKSGSIP